MKKILIASCLVIALLATGCKKKEAATAPTPSEPAATTQPAPEQPVAGQAAQPATTAGQTAADPGAQERCERLKKEYFPIQLDRLRVTLEYKTKMLATYKAAGKPTGEVNIAIGQQAQEMQGKLDEVLKKHGFQSTADLNTQDCQNFASGSTELDPKARAEFEELAKKLAEIDQELVALSQAAAQAQPTAPVQPATKPASPTPAQPATPAPPAP